MNGAAETEFFSTVLAASAYRAGDRVREYRDLIIVLGTIHTFREDADPRCRTCRDSAGRPAPFPCSTDLLVQVATGAQGIPLEDIIELRNTGRQLNGQKPLPDSGLRRELGPLLELIHDAHGFEWADPERLPRA
jgi:hypothetical protein